MKLLLHPLSQRQIERLVAAPGGSVMLHGPEGVGKHTAALEVARQVNCVGCGDESCRSCRLAAQGVHPDIVVVEPDDRQKIGIEAVQQLQHNLLYQQYESGNQRVVIIRDIHTMTLPAQNALLKTLEEPPVQTMVMVTATSPVALLETVVSRCRPIYLAPVGAGEIEGWLRAQPAVDRGTIPEVVAMSQGLVGRAQRLATSEEALTAERLVEARIRSLLTERGLFDRLVAAQAIPQKGGELQPYVQAAASVGRELARQEPSTAANNLAALERLRQRLAANVAPKAAFEALAVEVRC